MKIIERKLFGFIFLLFMLFPFTIYAETRITEGYLYQEGYWDKEGSPYILEDYVNVPMGKKLTIGAGVSILSSMSIENEEPYSIRVNGDIDILGNEEEPVHISGLGLIFLGKNNRIEHAVFDGTGLYGGFGTTTIISSTISGADTAIMAEKAFIEIEGSEISNNRVGIFSALWSPLPPMGYEGKYEKDAIGGIGNALGMDPDQNIITVHNTIFEGNADFAIKNHTANTIDATNNWWGSPDGPKAGVIGAIITDPWKKENPKGILCCSSILFLPGLEASRLYRSEQGLLGVKENQLWEPNRNDDVRKLFLNSDGTSSDPSIYTSDILESAFGIKDIYKEFFAMMNGVVAEKIINEWLPFAYDWRMNVSDIISDGTQYATTTKNLVLEIEKLAQTSKTGKVTIIAHSNGGFLAKILGYELERQGKYDLIDKVFFVAVPHLGTPQAVVGMLHGDSQSILGGAILSGAVARTLGINMAGAYGLLPSSEYLRRIVAPIATLAGNVIDSYSSLVDFLVGGSDKRTQPKENDLKKPAVLSPAILAKSEWLHSIIDPWKFPAPIKVFSIIGWGIPTLNSLSYGLDSITMGRNVDGDGTVVADSAGGYGGQEIYFNQGLFRHEKKKNIYHADILESDSVLSFMEGLISTSSPLYPEDTLPPYLSYERPDASDYPWMSWITVGVHSPVDIHAYDSHGGHIGVIPLPDNPDSDIKWIENTISGGQYDSIGDEKYITLPADDTYSILLNGTGTGEFMFDVKKFVGGDMIEVASSTYSDLPVTPDMIATTSVSPFSINPPLNIDNNGDSQTDLVVGPCHAI